MDALKTLSEEDLLKLKAVALYVLNKCGELDYFHLFKILYFADKNHYAKWGRRIIKDTFCALPKGPVPSVLFDAIKIVTKQSNSHFNKRLHIISDALDNPDTTYYYILHAKEMPDMDYLSKSDREELDKSILENKNIDIQTLSDRSHDSAWKDAWNKKPATPIDPLKMAESGGADSSMMAYIKEMAEIDKCL